MGDAEPVEPLRLLSVPSNLFLIAMKKHNYIWDITAAYCKLFCDRIGLARPPEPWPSDIFVSWEFSDLVMAMEPHQQQLIGNDALKFLPPAKSWRRTSPSPAQLLSDEVRRGLSVVLNRACEVERVVFLTVVRIEYDGSVLAQLEKLENGKITAKCVLPGTKQELNEMLRPQRRGPGVCVDRRNRASVHTLFEIRLRCNQMSKAALSG